VTEAAMALDIVAADVEMVRVDGFGGA
jgi:hypothetical protein